MIDKAIKEFNHLKEKTGIELIDEEGKSFLGHISEAESLTEVNIVRINMIVAYSKAILDQCENIIESFSKRLVDVKKDNDTLFDMGKKLESLSKIKKDEEEIVKECFFHFNDIWNFFEKIIMNEKNIIVQSKKDFWFSILPKWSYLFSGGWIALIGLLLYLGKIEFSTINVVIIVLGWFVTIIVGGSILWLFIYGIRSKNKDTSIYINKIKKQKEKQISVKSPALIFPTSKILKK